MPQLQPELSAHTAVKLIYAELLETLNANYSGTLQGLDSECLHDFRVAVRKTRTGLTQLKAVLPENVTRRFKLYFAWLGQITTPVRDLDVYVLNFPHYKASLPLVMQADLEPLHTLLIEKQAAAQKGLIQQLQSEYYWQNLHDWEAYLHTPFIAENNPPKLSIKQLADDRIWKSYRQVIKQGQAIKAKSPPVALHELRKTCKKLRYLLEFFAGLYPSEKIKQLLKALKELQELLGNFQDCAVQEQTLMQFSAEMQQQNHSPVTFTAIAELIQILEIKRIAARENFKVCFAAFAAAKNRYLFKELFVN